MSFLLILDVAPRLRADVVAAMYTSTSRRHFDETFKYSQPMCVSVVLSLSVTECLIIIYLHFCMPKHEPGDYIGCKLRLHLPTNLKPNSITLS